jgi:protein involved in polysaccharide export with SLBB domain
LNITPSSIVIPFEEAAQIIMKGNISHTRLLEVAIVLPVVLLARVARAADAPQATTAPAYVFIAGELKAPGRYPWTNGMRLTEAIERAAGYTFYADLAHIRITRSGTNVIVCDYNAAVASPGKNLPLAAGDSVLVPRGEAREAIRDVGRKFNVQLELPPPGGSKFIVVEEEVNRPGQFRETNGMTLSVLVELAGGLTKGADLDRILLYRQGGIETLSYTKVTNSPRWNPPVGGGARIVVPRILGTNQLASPAQPGVR